MTIANLSPALVRASYLSPLGLMTLAASDVGLRGVWFDGQAHQPQCRDWAVNDRQPVLREAMEQLNQYFAAQRAEFSLALDLQSGTEFQQIVWRALLSIPAGATCTYAELSRRIGKPGAVRAVGAAIARNPLCIVLPCHRVVGSSGALTGYAGGLQRKAALLKLERSLEQQRALGPALR